MNRKFVRNRYKNGLQIYEKNPQIRLYLEKCKFKQPWNTVSPLRLTNIEEIWQHILLAKLCRNRHFQMLLVGMQIDTILWREIWQYVTKLQMHLSFSLTICLVGIYPKRIPPKNQKCLCRRLFIEAWFVIEKFWKQLKCP